MVKCHELLTRQGVVVPERTLQRYALEVCGHRRGRGPTVRIADGRPGDECQIDFGRMGSLYDPAAERARAAYVLIFTACFSRHCFVWVCFSQTTEAVITSNREPVEWLGLMAHPLLAQSAIDRLQSAAYELVLEREPYRRRQKPGLSPIDPSEVRLSDVL